MFADVPDARRARRAAGRDLRSPAPARARFTPPREAAFDFRLSDQDGRPTSLADARGKVVAMTFIYSSCRDLCPAEGNEIGDALTRMSAAQASRPTSCRVDPVSDTPARAKEWLKRRGLPAGRGRTTWSARGRSCGRYGRHYGIVAAGRLARGGRGGAAGLGAFLEGEPVPAWGAEVPVRVAAATAGERAAAGGLSGHARPAVPRAGSPRRGLGLRALRLRAADRQARRAARGDPVRAAQPGFAGARHAGAPGRALSARRRRAPAEVARVLRSGRRRHRSDCDRVAPGAGGSPVHFLPGP